jgi:hypothetical protein
MPSDPGIEAVARWLCKSAEYMDGNWRLYLQKAQDVVDVYLEAAGQ